MEKVWRVRSRNTGRQLENQVGPLSEVLREGWSRWEYVILYIKAPEF